MDITHKISLDLQQTGARQVMFAKQGDCLTRIARLLLYDGGTEFTVPSGTIMQIAYAKPDGKGGVYDTMPDGSVSCTVSGNVVTAKLHPQMFSVAGIVACELRLLTGSGAQLTTFSWFITVQASAAEGIVSEDYFRFASLDGLRSDVGDLSKLSTVAKDNLVAAINEVLGKLPADYVTSVAGMTGDVTLGAANIAANVDGIPADNVADALAYLQDQIGDLSTPIPIARGQSGDGAAYVAAGESLPDVKPGSNGKHEGKGKQIIFISDHSSNTIESPTLQINGGDAVPIRMRAPKNQGTYESNPDATLPVPVGALMVGVPYTMTFCGMYWLVDSQIAQYACAEDQSQAELLREAARQLVSLLETDTIGMPIINSLDGVGTAKATIVRSETEDGNPDVSGNVTLPTEARVKEMTEACVVNMTKNADGTYTADKTFAELKAAHAVGRTVICSFRDRTQPWNGAYRLPLVYPDDTAMGFAAVVDQEQGNRVYLWAYINSGGMGHTATEIAAKDTVSAMIAAAIGDTATALSDMDSVIGGAGA